MSLFGIILVALAVYQASGGYYTTCPNIISRDLCNSGHKTGKIASFYAIKIVAQDSGNCDILQGCINLIKANNHLQRLNFAINKDGFVYVIKDWSQTDMAEGIIGLIGQFQKLNKDPTPVALIALTRLLGCGTYKGYIHKNYTLQCETCPQNVAKYISIFEHYKMK